MDAMTIPDVWSGQDRALTVEDMENMPDDEFRYELDDGVLIVSPAPSTLHQLAVARLTEAGWLIEKQTDDQSDGAIVVTWIRQP